MADSNLKTIREINGLSRVQLARKLNVTENTVKLWETKKARIPKGCNAQLCSLFQVEPIYLSNKQLTEDMVAELMLRIQNKNTNSLNNSDTTSTNDNTKETPTVQNNEHEQLEFQLTENKNELKFNNLRLIRSFKKMSLNDVSKELNVHNTTVSKWESGIHRVSQKNLELLSILYEIEPKYFYDCELPPEIKEFAENQLKKKADRYPIIKISKEITATKEREKNKTAQTLNESFVAKTDTTSTTTTSTTVLQDKTNEKVVKVDNTLLDSNKVSSEQSESEKFVKQYISDLRNLLFKLNLCTLDELYMIQNMNSQAMQKLDSFVKLKEQQEKLHNEIKTDGFLDILTDMENCL